MTPLSGDMGCEVGAPDDGFNGCVADIDDDGAANFITLSNRLPSERLSTPFDRLTLSILYLSIGSKRRTQCQTVSGAFERRRLGRLCRASEGVGYIHVL
jgi:hypothetical protein